MPSTAQNIFTQLKIVPLMSPQMARNIDIRIAPSKTLVRGTIMAEVTATPGFYDAYTNGGAGGLGVPLGILMYDVTTNAAGAITSISGPFATIAEDINTPMYVSGYFATAEIVGDLTNALAVSGFGRLIQGSVTVGILKM